MTQASEEGQKIKGQKAAGIQDDNLANFALIRLERFGRLALAGPRVTFDGNDDRNGFVRGKDTSVVIIMWPLNGMVDGA